MSKAIEHRGAGSGMFLWRRIGIGLAACVALAAGSGGGVVAGERPSGETVGWKLVWSDEFGRDGTPDPRN